MAAVWLADWTTTSDSLWVRAAYLVFIAISSAISITFLFRYKDGENVDPQEPPVLRPKIPYIGHMIGLLTHHNNYFDMLSNRFKGPIYTVKILSSRIYIVQSPDLAQSAFKQSKEIDFNSFKVWGCRAIAYDKAGIDVVAFKPEKGDSYMNDLHQDMVGSLSQGPNLLETNARVLNYLAKSLNEIGSSRSNRYPLFRWLRDEYTMASAEALYGKKNPVSDDPSLIQSIWDFERDLGLLVLDFYPQFTAPKGNKGRAVVAPKFQKYYDDGLSKNAAAFVQGRERVGRQWGLTTEHIAKAEITIIMAAGTNTVPNVFYMICHIFSKPQLLESLRTEISEVITRKNRNGTDLISLNISLLQTHCPLLTACLNETYRLTKTGASVRTILSDVLLDDTYLLKKGSFVQIPTGVLHTDPSTWGPDSTKFNPYRFLNQDSLPKEAKKAQGQAFIPFGGGKNLCPGRHLAYTEIVAFVAMLVYGFEIEMVDGSELVVPKGEFQKLGVASISPSKDLDVLIKRKTEFEGVEWDFEL